jgi:hypothetical protein
MRLGHPAQFLHDLALDDIACLTAILQVAEDEPRHLRLAVAWVVVLLVDAPGYPSGQEDRAQVVSPVERITAGPDSGALHG